MACLKMQEQQQNGGLMGPRISFSNDFGDIITNQQSSNLHENTIYREAPVSSDFEFSVPTFTSNSADELFFKTKINPPLKDKVVTLRDELLAADEDDDDDMFVPRLIMPKNSGWWREKFGLRKSQTPKKGTDHHKFINGGLETIDEASCNANITGRN